MDTLIITIIINIIHSIESTDIDMVDMAMARMAVRMAVKRSRKIKLARKKNDFVDIIGSNHLLIYSP